MYANIKKQKQKNLPPAIPPKQKAPELGAASQEGEYLRCGCVWLLVSTTCQVGYDTAGFSFHTD